LAFLLGGSAAFGQYASSDAATITGYLNRIQDKYFFVNAGVPGWNSTQEMFRLAFQILDYRPALVMTYDGANDATVLGTQYSKGLTTYPIGTPNDFEDLAALVDHTQAQSRKNAVVRAQEYLLPEVTKFIRGTAPTEEKKTDSFVYFRADRKMVKVMLHDILYIESMKDYVKVVTDKGTIITKQSISSVEAMLPEKEFIRTHRSFIVSTRHIKSFTAELIELQNMEIPIGKLFRNEVMKTLG
jgi:hypothetical protein